MATMNLEEYLENCWRIHDTAVRSNLDPGLLRRMGGCLAIAGEHADAVRVQKDAYLGFIDRDRTDDEIRRLGSRRWRAVETEIKQQIADGVPPTKAVERVMERHGTVPHTPEQVQDMGQLITGPHGTTYRWLYDLRVAQARIARGASVMQSTVGAIVAGFYLMATAENWSNATPAEWDMAFAAGELGATVEGVAGAMVAPRIAREQTRAMVDSAQTSKPVAAQVAPRRPGNATRGTAPPETTARGTTVRPTSTGQRGTGTRGVSPTARGTGPRGTRSGAEDTTSAEVEEAFREGAPFRTSKVEVVGRRTHRKGPLAGQRYASLETIAEKLTPAQRRAVASIMGKFPPKLRARWDDANNSKAQTDLATVRQRWHQGDKEGARQLAREVFDGYVGRFWRRVVRAMKTDAEIARLFTDLGVKFDPRNPGKAPYWELPDGTTEAVTIDHNRVRLHDDPTFCVDSSNLVFSPASENSYTLEKLRAAERAQR
jgi:hypothetical protein